MKPDPPRDQHPRWATIVAAALIGAGLGACAGWAVAEAGIQGGYVDSETRYFVSTVLGLAAAGGILGTGFGTIVAKRRPVVSERALLRAAALTVLIVGLLFAVFLNHGCDAWVHADEPGVQSGLLVRCARPDARVPLRMAIGIGAAVVALTLLLVDRARSTASTVSN